MLGLGGHKGWFFWGLVFLGVAPLCRANAAHHKEALQYVKRAEAADSGFASEQVDLEMRIYNASGDSHIRKLSMKIQEIKGDGDRSLIIFHYPKDVSGTKMLTWNHKKQEDDQWLYLPSLNKVQRITSRSKTGSFMGSEFSYEDLGSQEIDKYVFQKISKQDKGRTLIQRKPIDKNSGYSRQVVAYDDRILQPLRIDYYDRKGELLKTAVFEGYKKFGRFWRAGSIRMENHQTKKKSILVWQNESRKLGVAIEPGALERDSLRD